MKAKLVYVVVSDKSDYYLEQAFVSMSSARYHTPNVHITLVMDKCSADNLDGFRKTETQLADEIVVVDMDKDIPAQKRSRLLKTSLRNIIDGDFLYIDCDTVVVNDLSSIDSFDFSFGAVKDLNSNLDSNPSLNSIANNLKKLDVNINNIYYNSGVLYLKDNAETRAFFDVWNKYYKIGYAKGVPQDQPSFAKTYSENGIVSSLGDEWNCQIYKGMRYLLNAKIVHYFSSNASFYILNDKSVCMEIREKQEISEKVKSLFDNPCLGIVDNSCIISGEEYDFYTSKYYSSLQSLLLKKTFVGKLIKVILSVNTFYCHFKKKLQEKIKYIHNRAETPILKDC